MLEIIKRDRREEGRAEVGSQQNGRRWRYGGDGRGVVVSGQRPVHQAIIAEIGGIIDGQIDALGKVSKPFKNAVTAC